MTAHLAARDTRLVAVSRAPREKLEATAKRMGWTFPWYSSGDGDFNYDFDVSFLPEYTAGEGAVRYNFASIETRMTDLPGISAFIKEPDGAVYRTYSAYARGLDMLNPAYQLLDLTALGRQEDDSALPDGLGEAARRIRTRFCARKPGGFERTSAARPVAIMELMRLRGSALPARAQDGPLRRYVPRSYVA